MFVCFMHAEGDDRQTRRHRGVEQQRSTSGNSIFPAAPLCLNSWSQSAFRTSFDVFFSTIFILLNQQAASTDDAVYLFIRTLIILPFYHTCDPLLHNQASDLTSKGVFILCGDSLAPGPAQLTTDTNMESPQGRPPVRAGPSPARACERCLVLVF